MYAYYQPGFRSVTEVLDANKPFANGIFIHWLLHWFMCEVKTGQIIPVFIYIGHSFLQSLLRLSNHIWFSINRIRSFQESLLFTIWHYSILSCWGIDFQLIILNLFKQQRALICSILMINMSMIIIYIIGILFCFKYSGIKLSWEIQSLI